MDGAFLDNTMSRRVSAQEATISKDESTESQFECPICINWLDEPLLTSCGHRFCKKCITAWLKKPNPCCPVDNQPLTTADLFPDNFTRREIKQIRRHCPHAEIGCAVVLSPLEMDAHLVECSFAAVSKQKRQPECPFTTCGCTFKCTEPNQMESHLHAEMAGHLNLLMSAFNKNRQALDNNRLDTASRQWEAPYKQQPENGTTPSVLNGEASAAVAHHHQQRSSSTDANLLKALYERIIVLEQQTREQDSKLTQLTQQFARHRIDPRYSGGVLVWQITQFSAKVAAMSADPNHMLYSGESYTSPHGYRFCVRLNISAKFPGLLGLHVHLMQSDNDFHLDWPFRGRIKISMIHRNLNETQHDTIMSKPEILAFHRPSQEISPRGFGFLEYAGIEQVLANGFVVGDTLSLKVQLSIV